MEATLEDFLDSDEEKYIVLPKHAVEEMLWLSTDGEASTEEVIELLRESFLTDAMVIREQDEFAAAAFQAYIAAVETFRLSVGTLCPEAITDDGEPVNWQRLYQVQQRFETALMHAKEQRVEHRLPKLPS